MLMNLAKESSLHSSIVDKNMVTSAVTSFSLVEPQMYMFFELFVKPFLHRHCRSTAHVLSFPESVDDNGFCHFSASFQLLPEYVAEVAEPLFSTVS